MPAVQSGALSVECHLSGAGALQDRVIAGLIYQVSVKSSDLEVG